MPLGCC